MSEFVMARRSGLLGGPTVRLYRADTGETVEGEVEFRRLMPEALDYYASMPRPPRWPRAGNCASRFNPTRVGVSRTSENWGPQEKLGSLPELRSPRSSPTAPPY